MPNPDEPSRGHRDRSAPPSILVVEDDEGLRPILARHLRRQGYDVSEAASAEEATEVLERGSRPALVVLDLNLPGATGWDLLRSPAMRSAGRPAVVITSAITVSPKRLAEFEIAGYSAQAVLARDAAPDGPAGHRTSHGGGARAR